MEEYEPIQSTQHNYLDNDYEEEPNDEIYIDDEEHNNNLYDKIYDIYTRMNNYIKDYGLNLLQNHSLDNFIKFYLSETGNKFLSGDTH